MNVPGSVSPRRAPTVNALQRIWLREIGLEKVWARPAVALAAQSIRKVDLLMAGQTASGSATVISVEPIGSAMPGTIPTSVAVPVVDEAVSPSDDTGVTERAGTRAGIALRPGFGPSTRPPVAPVAIEEAPRIPVAQAAANANVDELRELVVACNACGLCDGRRHAVFGMGAQPAKWMVVGEAPGEQEDMQGLPFVGRSGQLLDAMLSAVGVSRERDVFITNVIKCRPPGNRNPKPEEIAACSPYLMRQIALLKPERILVLGRFAAQTLLGTSATIGSLRGRTHMLATDDGRSIPVVVSYHPAYLLRSPTEKARAWQDLTLAATL